MVLFLNVNRLRVQLPLESRPIGSKPRFLLQRHESDISDLLLVYVKHPTKVVELFVDSLAVQSTAVVELETGVLDFNVGL